MKGVEGETGRGVVNGVEGVTGRGEEAGVESGQEAGTQSESADCVAEESYPSACFPPSPLMSQWLLGEYLFFLVRSAPSTVGSRAANLSRERCSLLMCLHYSL